jgi:glycosyltransferase involved in cell wall biosynthesis
MLKEKIPDIRLVIVGRGQQKEELLQLVDDKKLDEHVIFKQDLSDEELIRQMKESEILVLPSTREGFGMVLAEANCCHKPVIAYNSGGTAEVIDQDKTGYLIEAGDKKELTRKIEKLLLDKELQHEMGENGRHKVEDKYDWDKLSDEYIQLVKSLIK